MAGDARQLAPCRLAGLPTSLLARTAQVARGHVADALAADGARELHYVVLAALGEVGPVGVTELARDTGVDRADVAATVGILQRRGEVERTADSWDRRRVLVALTPAGKERLRHLDRSVHRAQSAFLAGLDARERDQLVRLLTTLLTR